MIGQLTGNGHVTVGLSLLNDLKHLLGATDKPLCGSLYVDHLVLVLVNSQVYF